MIVVKRLVWEKINIDHIARHEVTPKEVEEVCHSKYVALDAHHGRFMIVGPTKAKRILAVIIDPEPESGVYYPVTAKNANKREQQKYHIQRRRL